MTLEQPRLHAVCGHLEIDEMTRCYVDSGQVTQDLNELELDEHQALLLTMKWPGYKFYRGGWGDELLLVPKNPEPTWNTMGFVYTTVERRMSIRYWISANAFD